MKVTNREPAPTWADWIERGYTMWDLYYTPEATELAARIFLTKTEAPQPEGQGMETKR